MSNELFVTYPGVNSVYVIIIRPVDGFVWEPISEIFVFEADLLTNIDIYDIPLSNLVGYEYAVDMPPEVPFGTEFKAQYYEQAGVSPIVGDLILDTSVGTWTGTISAGSGAPIGDAYSTIVEAQTYMDGKLNTDAWDDATVSDQTTSLIQATTIIDRLNFNGLVAVEGQALSFPRGTDTVVPEDIKNASHEIALALLDGVDPELEYENLFMNSQGYANIRSSHNPDFAPPSSIHGVPSITAWRFLLPYLRDDGVVTISRTS